MMQKRALRAAGWVFLWIGLMHGLRVLLRVRVIVQDFTIPQAFSMVAAVVLLGLSGWMFFSSK